MSAVDVRKPIRLDYGSHAPTEGEYCAMELVSFVAGERWSDHPQCTSPTLGRFLRSMNDRLDPESRQRLVPYLVLCDDAGDPILSEEGRLQPGPVIGTAGTDADEDTRRWMCMDWLVREYYPAMLRLAGMTDHAEALEQLVSITSSSIYDTVRPTVRAAIDATWEKRKSWYERVRIAVADAVADADAGAVAVAVAVAVAGADAGAVAGAVAVAGAGAGAGAVADAGAGAVAGAGADADAVLKNAIQAAADAKAKGGDYYAQRDAAYAVFLPFYKELFGDITEGLLTSSLLLLDRLIAVGKTPQVEAA